MKLFMCFVLGQDAHMVVTRSAVCTYDGQCKSSGQWFGIDSAHGLAFLGEI